MKQTEFNMYSPLTGILILILLSFSGRLVTSEHKLALTPFLNAMPSAFDKNGSHATDFPNNNVVMDCLNRNQPRQWKTSMRHALRDEMTAVPVAGAWSSRHPPKVPATLVTQLSLDRLKQLEAQCRSWSGPISSVVYMALRLRDDWVKEVPPTTSDSLQAALEELKEFHERMEEGHVCQLDMMLVYEWIDDDNAKLIYPVNILRNYARLQARTPLIALFDVDMLPSKSLLEELSDLTKLGRLFNLTLGYGNGDNSPGVVVFPAFVVRSLLYYRGDVKVLPEIVADKMVNSNKPQLRKLWTDRIIKRFDPTATGHKPTQFSKWLNADYQQYFYEVTYQPRYEPWILCDRRLVPWYDSRFRGFGQNKIVHLAHVNQSGFRFIVHSNVWLVHRSHKSNVAKDNFLKNMRNDVQRRSDDSMVSASVPPRNMYQHNSRLGMRIQEELKRDSYDVVLDPPTAACMGTLPWWRL